MSAAVRRGGGDGQTRPSISKTSGNALASPIAATSHGNHAACSGIADGFGREQRVANRDWPTPTICTLVVTACELTEKVTVVCLGQVKPNG